MAPDRMMQGLSSAFSHIDPENVSNGQLYSLLYSMRAQQIQSNLELERLRTSLEDHKKELKELKNAWDTATTMVKFVKFLGTVGLPVAGIIAIVKVAMSKLGLWT